MSPRDSPTVLTLVRCPSWYTNRLSAGVSVYHPHIAKITMNFSSSMNTSGLLQTFSSIRRQLTQAYPVKSSKTGLFSFRLARPFVVIGYHANQGQTQGSGDIHCNITVVGKSADQCQAGKPELVTPGTRYKVKSPVNSARPTLMATVFYRESC